MQKNSCMFEFPAFLPPTNLGLPMHSPSALTEHVSLNLARFFCSTLYTIIASYFWSGARVGFFHTPWAGEHWSRAERTYGMGGTKGDCSRRNGAYPSLLLSNMYHIWMTKPTPSTSQYPMDSNSSKLAICPFVLEMGSGDYIRASLIAKI